MAYCIWDVSHVLLGHTVIFGLRTKKPKNRFKKNFFPALGDSLFHQNLAEM